MTEQLKEVYKVRVKKFTDKEDNDRVYKLGDIYPAEGAPEPSEKRIAALSSRANKARIQIIKKTTVTVVDAEDEGEGEQEVKALADHNKADLQKLLDEKGVEYNKSDNKDVLIQKLEEAAEQEEEEEDEEE